MDIKTFAAAHRLRTAVDSDGTVIIKGRDGQIYEHGDGSLGLLFISERFTSREGWNTRRKQCAAAGMELHQDGDYEGSLLFDPKDKPQAQLAIKVSGVRPKRQISPEQLCKLQTASQQYRFPARATVLQSAGAI